MKDKQIMPSLGQTDCPHCGQQNNAHAGDAAPVTGDWSVCYGCHKISRFIVPPDLVISVRKATASELVDFVRDVPDLAVALADVDPEIAEAMAECRRRDAELT